MKPDETTTNSDHIEAYVGDDASHVNVGKDISSVSMGGVEGGIHGSTIAGRDVHSNKTFIQYIFAQPQGTLSEERELKNRTVMFQRVREYWIEGVLQQSLYKSSSDKSPIINLGMTVETGAVVVNRPWTITVQMPQQPQQPQQQLAEDMQIIDVFDQMQQSLLILGEPGSGKTTTLLELARDLIKRAENNPANSIPVVFNLSSWANKQESITNWLTDELITKYTIPKKLAQSWIETDAVLPLLDGLDEVEELYRNECIQKINQYIQDRTTILSIVVCCRLADYNALSTRLSLQNAILIEPLTLQKINSYFDELGDDFRLVKKAVQQDHELQDLAQSPFMLNIIAVTFGGMESEELQSLQIIGSYQEELFNRYIKKTFMYRGDKDSSYSQKQIVSWLAWLADRLHTHQQTIFLLELMQPSWLPTKAQQRFYRQAVGLAVGLVFGVVFGLLVGLRGGLVVGLVLGLVLGLLVGLGFSLVDEIRPIYQITWSWRSIKIGLVVGLLVGLASVVLHRMQEGLGGKLFLDLFYGLVVGLLYGLLYGLEQAVHNMTIETITSRPNQGIKQSGKNALFIGLFVGLSGGLIGVLIVGLSGGLLFGLFFGLPFGLRSGSHAWIQHFVLRYILYRSGSIPRDYVSFLDYCVERILLRKVGGGYIFIHRMLLEHFANMTDEDIQRLASK